MSRQAEQARAHVCRLMAETGVGYSTIARAAGLSAKTVAALLEGRETVAARTVDRLCRVGVLEVRAARRFVPADEIRPFLLRLQQAGWTDAQIAREAGCAQKVVQDIRTGRTRQVRDVTARRILHACRALTPTQWRQLAQCRLERLPTALFYDPDRRDEAIRVCSRCVVRADCAAAGDGDEYGMWGGVWRHPRPSRPAV